MLRDQLLTRHPMAMSGIQASMRRMASLLAMVLAACGDSNGPAGSPVTSSPAPTGLEVAALPTTTTQVSVRLAQQSLFDEFPGRIQSVTNDDVGPVVEVAPDEELLAAELDARDGVDVVGVGALAYPIEAAVEVCPDAPPATSMKGLEVDIEPPAGPISAPGIASAIVTVRLTNTGDSPISFESGAATGAIIDAAGDIVNATVGAGGDVGVPVNLDIGASIKMEFGVGTGSCDPALGYVLAPGPYRLIALIPQLDGPYITSDPLPIVVGS